MPLDPEQQERYITIWSKAIDTQMHFNEMSVKSRQLGLTFVAAALGVGIVLLSRGDDFQFLFSVAGIPLKLHVSIILLLGSCIALLAVRILDLKVYHKMLRGAVKFGEDFEENYMKEIFDLEKGLTQAITHFSQHENAQAITNSDNKKYTYTGTDKTTAFEKIKNFYFWTIFSIVAGSILIFFVTNVPLWLGVEQTPQEMRVSDSEEKLGEGIDGANDGE